MEIKDGVFPVHRWSSIVVSGHIDWRLKFFCEDYCRIPNDTIGAPGAYDGPDIKNHCYRCGISMSS